MKHSLSRIRSLIMLSAAICVLWLQSGCKSGSGSTAAVLPTFLIIADAGQNGMISPSGDTSVTQGDTVVFTFTPNTGYVVADVVVDGVSEGASQTYTFIDVNANHTIMVSFVDVTYQITATAGTGGSVSPAGNVSVPAGSDAIFTFTPDSGYVVDTVTVDGTPSDPFDLYTFENVSGSHLIQVTFALKTADSAEPGTPETGLPTVKCIGARWVIGGDANANAVVSVYYRKTGDTSWRNAMYLRRAQRAYMSAGLVPPDGSVLHAGSIFGLDADTDYDIRLDLLDPDGGSTQRILTAHTWSEPFQASALRTLHVAPGSGGGTGTESDPYLGIETADAQAQPGDLILLHGGTYTGQHTIETAGTPDAPIVWRAADNETPILDGGDVTSPAIINVNGLHDVYFEGFRLQNANHAFSVFGCQRLVFRELAFSGVWWAVDASTNGNERLWISDCDIQGITTWPPAGQPERRAIEIAGEGSVVCHNRINGFKDGIDTADIHPTRDIDIYLNDISVCSDDGMELDFSDCNVRAFDNRLTNCYQGISFQPIMGGPAYAIRNSLYNIQVEPFKLHANGTQETSGAVLLHNSVSKQDTEFFVNTSDTMHRVLMQNNLFVSRDSTYAFCTYGPSDDCLFNYNVYCGGPFLKFGKFSNISYDTLAQFQAGSGMETNGVYHPGFDGLFVSGVTPPVAYSTECPPSDNDLRPAADNPGVDAGTLLPNINDGYAGNAPDAGCLEYGLPLPAYGPRY